jgi:hypothetical protein
MDDSILEDKQRRWVPWLMAVTALTAAYAVAVGWTGGFTLRIGEWRLRSHSWIRPAIVAAAGSLVLLYAAGAQVTRFVTRSLRAAESAPAAATLAGIASVWAATVGIAFGTFAIGGADSYGYVAQARLLAHGHLTDQVPSGPAYAWPDAAATFTPLGFTPTSRPGIVAPKYPPGLAMLMAPLSAISERAVYFLVPCFGAGFVWLTFRLGVALGDRRAGAFAAVLLAISPTFLYQVVQPMSDVPAAACWLAALLLAARGTTASAAMSALVTSLAVLIRPNLVPLAAIVFVVALLGNGKDLRRAFTFAAVMLPGFLVLGWIQQVRYGSPVASGYGTLSDAFAIAYVSENLARYPRWITETHTWFIWLACGAPLWIAYRATRRVLAWAALAIAAAVWLSYLPYIYFHPEEWFYTRFLLPSIAIMLVFAAAITTWILDRLPLVVRGAVVAALLTVLIVHGLQVARTRGAFDIRNQERKYPLAGQFVRDRLPSNAMVLAAQHSGSIRYYAGRPTFRWDLLAPSRLDQALAVFRAQGYEPVLVVDGGEYDEFRKRFDAANQEAPRGASLLAILADARIYALPKQQSPITNPESPIR